MTNDWIMPRVWPETRKIKGMTAQKATNQDAFNIDTIRAAMKKIGDIPAPGAFGMGPLKIVEDIHLTVLVADWSDCRSPSRARRRLEQGHKQKIVYRQKPDPRVTVLNGVAYMHPEVANEFRLAMDRSNLTMGFF